MKLSIKKLSKRTKWMIPLLTIVLIVSITFYLKRDKGVNYTLPQETDAQKSFPRKIKDYMGNDFEWFLYTPDRVAMYVKEVGEGETIVVLHGGYGMTHNYMRNFLKSFEDDYHMVYYDQRGSTRSPVPDDDFEQYVTMENMVNDLELLRRALKVDKLRLIAHSMGAILAYEYMKKFPDHAGDVVIISGHPPKLPETNAEFFDAYTSKNDEAAFKEKQLEQMRPAIEQLKQNVDSTSAEFIFIRWKMQSVALQIYDVTKWRNTFMTAGLYNYRLNRLIGPENVIPLHHLWRFYNTQRQFDNGTLDTMKHSGYKTPVNFVPVIENHQGRIDYILGTHDIADWNLRLQRRNIKQTEKVKMHVFQNAGHNIWMDKPEEFEAKLTEILMKSDSIR